MNLSSIFMKKPQTAIKLMKVSGVSLHWSNGACSTPQCNHCRVSLSSEPIGGEANFRLVFSWCWLELNQRTSCCT